MAVEDPRLTQTVRVAGTPVHQPIGPPDAQTNRLTAEAAAALTRLMTTAADVNAGGAGPLAKGQMIAVAAAPAIAALNTAAQRVLTHTQELADRMGRPVFSDPTGAHTVVSVAIAQAFAAAAPSESAQMLHEARQGADEPLLRSLATMSRALTRLTPAEHAGLTTTAHRLADPAGFAATAAEVEQVAAAREALGRMADLIQRTGIARTDLSAAAPNLAPALAVELPRWAPERPEDATHAA